MWLWTPYQGVVGLLDSTNVIHAVWLTIWESVRSSCCSSSQGNWDYSSHRHTGRCHCNSWQNILYRSGNDAPLQCHFSSLCTQLCTAACLTREKEACLRSKYSLDTAHRSKDSIYGDSIYGDSKIYRKKKRGYISQFERQVPCQWGSHPDLPRLPLGHCISGVDLSLFNPTWP